jgi:signal transduction histidine kinase
MDGHISAPHQIRRWRPTLLVGLAVMLLYAALFLLLYAQVGLIAGSLSVVPIALGGWRFGRRGGVLVGLLSVPLHIALFTLGGADGVRTVLLQWPGSAMGLVVGLGAGWVRAAFERSRRQADELARAKADLLAEVAQRERVERELRAASEAKSVFLGTISHELRTPLTMIMGYSELLERDLASHGLADLQADVDRIQASSRRLLTLITSMLDFARLETGAVEVLPELCDIPMLLNEVSGFVMPMMELHRNSLSVSAAPDLPPLETDLAKLRQILINLLVSAATSTEQGRVTLEVRPAPEADGVLFAVADTGPGIAPELLPRLFEPFAHTACLNQRGGVGLGLALCQRLCRLLGGTIGVSSTPGGGATFTVRLPSAAQLSALPSAETCAKAALR